MEKSTHSFHYEGDLLSIGGVTEVRDFSDAEINLSLAADSICIKGRDLVISELLIKDGKLTVRGQLESLSYGKGGAKVPLLKRLFK